LRSVDTCWRVRALLDRLALFLLSLIPERVKRWSERVWHWIKLPFIFVALILLALVGLMLAGGA
jgi:hypothetical protein